jgi:hypothetical protein
MVKCFVGVVIVRETQKRVMGQAKKNGLFLSKD